MHATGSTGPQIGHAAVLEDRSIYRSSERRPVLALADIQLQIAQANPDRYALGKPLHDAPSHIGQLVPLYANANPVLDAMLDGTPPPPIVTGSFLSPIRSARKSDHLTSDQRVSFAQASGLAA